MAAFGFGSALTVASAPPVRRAGFVLDGGLLPNGVTLSRSSTATYCDATGAFAMAAADAPRFDHDPRTGAARGLLVEDAATNLIAWSDGAVAQLVSAAGVADAPGSIAGFANAIVFVDSAVSRYAYKQFIPNVGQTLTLSVIVQMDDGGMPAIGRTTTSGDFCLLVGGKVLDLPVTIDAAPGDTYRCSVTYTATNAQSYWGVVRYPGQSARGFRATAMQLEAGVHASSYIATTSSAVTRAADGVTLDWREIAVDEDQVLVRYVFDDDSDFFAASDLSAGLTMVPDTLPRPRLRRIERW